MVEIFIFLSPVFVTDFVRFSPKTNLSGPTLIAHCIAVRKSPGSSRPQEASTASARSTQP